MFQGNLSVPPTRVESPFLGFLTTEGGIDILSRNVGKELPLLAVSELRKAKFSFTSRKKPKITCITIKSEENKEFNWFPIPEYDDTYIHQVLLTLNLLTTTIVAPPSNASKWQMGFNSAFKRLIFVSFGLSTVGNEDCVTYEKIHYF